MTGSGVDGPGGRGRGSTGRRERGGPAGWRSAAALPRVLLMGMLCGCDALSPPPRSLEGRWQLVEKRLATDGCNLVRPGLEGAACQLSCEPVTVRSTGAATWEMQFIERGGTAACQALPDGWFTCTTEDTRGPPDAQVHRTDTMEGRRQDDGTLRGIFALEMTCTGPGCSLQPAFAGGGRCETRGTFKGEWRGEL